MQKRLVHGKSNLFTQIISAKKLTSIAMSVGFAKLKPKKIDPVNIILSYMNFISGSNFSLNNWAISFTQLTHRTVSKQAIFKRINKKFIEYAKETLAEILKIQLQSNTNRNCNLFKHFKNVYLQDATHYSLAKHLVDLFPGNTTCGAKRAVAKVVTIFNIKKGCFSKFDLTHFTQADTASTNMIYQFIKARDLMIRDLGYFMISDFEKIKKFGAYFLSRYKLNVAIYDIKTSQQLNLAKLLKKQPRFDGQVMLSTKCPISVRLVAVPLPAKAVQERIRKAKADKRNEKTNHNKEYYFLLGFAIYITNIDETIWTVEDVCDAYRCRWHIEILFKSWKSNLKSQYTEPDQYATETSVKIHFYLLMVYVSVFIMPLLIKLEKMINKTKKNIQISVLKLTSYIALNLQELLYIIIDKQKLETIAYHTKYDSRTDRNNFMQFLYE